MKKLICIECPQGCTLEVEADGIKLLKVTGNSCPKGETYAASEIEDPRRVLTTSVLAVGQSLTMLPVRTDLPIPKASLMQAMEEVKRIRIDRALKSGEVVANNIAGTGANLIATRDL